MSGSGSSLLAVSSRRQEVCTHNMGLTFVSHDHDDSEVRGSLCEGPTAHLRHSEMSSAVTE